MCYLNLIFYYYTDERRYQRSGSLGCQRCDLHVDDHAEQHGDAVEQCDSNAAK